MVIGARIAEQRKPRKPFILDEKPGDRVPGFAGDCLQSRGPVEVHHGRNPVSQFSQRLVLEKHVAVGRSGAEKFRCPILKANRRHGSEMLPAFDAVEMVLHRCRGRGSKNAPAPQSSRSELRSTVKGAWRRSCGRCAPL